MLSVYVGWQTGIPWLLCCPCMRFQKLVEMGQCGFFFLTGVWWRAMLGRALACEEDHVFCDFGRRVSATCARTYACE